MGGSTFGTLFRVTTFGESHGPAIGAVIDGCPAGLPLCEEDIQKFLDRRKPGQSEFTTKRAEKDLVHIESGVFEGQTTGTPICLVIYNEDQKSADYSEISNVFRPGHADFGFYEKYGIRDYRGGGRSSGRETAARVAAGAVAIKILERIGVSFYAYTESIGDIKISSFDEKERDNNPLYMPDHMAYEKAANLLKSVSGEKDSLGGIICCRIRGLMPGIGESVFDKLDADLSKAIMSIGAVKGVEIGDGFSVALRKGSENNDSFFSENGQIGKRSNHSGGILGGMSDGSEIVLRAAVKATPSIAKEQETVDIDKNNRTIEIKGRHDPVIVPRAVVVVEAMSALCIVDHLFMNMTSKMSEVERFFKR